MKSNYTYDPDSLITGAELAKGFTFANSKRSWTNHEDYLAATRGEMTTEEILTKAPRIFTVKSNPVPVTYADF